MQHIAVPLLGQAGVARLQLRGGFDDPRPGPHQFQVRLVVLSHRPAGALQDAERAERGRRRLDRVQQQAPRFGPGEQHVFLGPEVTEDRPWRDRAVVGDRLDRHVVVAVLGEHLQRRMPDRLGGWSPPITFTAGQAHKVDCWFTADVHGGTPQVADGGKYSCLSGR
ncbi:MAG TPA: hypothetical protein VGM12_29695 [Trebonia sp.]